MTYQEAKLIIENAMNDFTSGKITPFELADICGQCNLKELEEKEIKQQEPKKEILTPVKVTIDEKIAECESNGFTVKKNRKWLWLNDTDGRYNKKVTDKQWGELTSKNEESKVLLSLGFQYSSTRGNFYWIGE